MDRFFFLFLGTIVISIPISTILFSEFSQQYLNRLDVKGGTSLVYKLNTSDETTREKTIELLRQRLQGRIAKYSVRKLGLQRISVDLTNVLHDKLPQIKKLLKLGNLELRLVATEKLKKDVVEEIERKKYQRLKNNSYAQQQYQRELYHKGFRWAKSKQGKPRLLWLKDKYNITGKDFDSMKYDSAQNYIIFALKSSAAIQLRRLTRNHRRCPLAIVFNNRIVSAPIIQGIIPDGRGILMGFSPKEAKELIKTVDTGFLNVSLKLVRENIITPVLAFKRDGLLVHIRFATPKTKEQIRQKLKKKIPFRPIFRNFINKKETTREFALCFALANKEKLELVEKQLQKIKTLLASAQKKSILYKKQSELIVAKNKLLEINKIQRNIRQIFGNVEILHIARLSKAGYVEPVIRWEDFYRFIKKKIRK